MLQQQLQETDDLISRLREARAEARKTLAVYQDPKTVLVQLPTKVKGSPPVWVPLPMEKLRQVVTIQILLMEMQSSNTDRIGQRVVAATTQVVRLLKSRSDATRRSVLRGIMELDRELATETARRTRLAEQLRQSDQRQAGKPAGALDLEGLWRRSDGHEVQFRKSAGGFSGVATKLTTTLRDNRFSEGEETFRLKRTGPVSWEGQVKWRYSDGRSEWRPVTVTLKTAESMVDSSTGSWTRVK